MSSKALLNLILPPAPVGKRILATLCDLTLIFFLSVFVVGKLWVPIYYADVVVQFKWLLLEYSKQLQAGQFLDFINQINANQAILDMFVTIDRILFFIAWSYYSLNGIFLHGGSLGKQIFNLRVLKLSTLKYPTCCECIFRSGILTFFLFTAWPFGMCLNLCFICLNGMHRGFHDWFCQTYVVSYEVLEQIKEKMLSAANKDETDLDSE